LLPNQPPVAEQVAALVADQVKVELAFSRIDPGFAVKVSVGGGVETVTVAEALAVPPGPEQDKLKVVVALNGPVDRFPDTALDPAQPPDAVQLVVFAEDHASVALSSVKIEPGLAVRLMVGVGSPLTVTVTALLAIPPAPVQLRVKTLDAVSEPVDCEPDVSLAPVQAPEAVQVLASVELQDNTEVPPDETAEGFALSAIVGGMGLGTAITLIVICSVDCPPGPVQLSWKSSVSVKESVISLPEVAFAPPQPPEAIQLSASPTDQVNADLSLGAIEEGFAESTIDGLGPVSGFDLSADSMQPDNGPTMSKQTNAFRVFNFNPPCP
jgi:hypothetical protein